MIINSLLDTDLYKCTMSQTVLHQFPNIWVEYKFKCRNENIIWTQKMVNEINKEIDHFCTLMLLPSELLWVSSLRYIKKDFVEFLRIYRPQRQHIQVDLENGKLDITVKGPWFLTIFFEVPVLSIVNEIYFKNTVLGDRDKIDTLKFYETNGMQTLLENIKIAKSEQFLFSDFGTRRRFSFDWQEVVIQKLMNDLPRTIFGGTSNMYFAYKYNLVPIGTMAHEFICVGQALDDVTLANSQKYMLQAWVDEYRGDLGTALSDTLGTDKFLKDFDLYFAKLYDGVRHDSGDPFKWGERIIDHYRQLKIDPRTKQLVFSDGLTFAKAAELNKYFKLDSKDSFGIGTRLTNDFIGVEPLNIVMKVVSANDRPVAKLSDNPGKTMCEDKEFISYLMSVI